MTTLKGAITEMISYMDDNNKRETLNVIVHMIRRILDFPDNIKYRCLRKENKIFVHKLLRHEGSSQVLKLIGFEEDEQKWYFPNSRNMDSLICNLTEIESFIQEKLPHLNITELSLSSNQHLNRTNMNTSNMNTVNVNTPNMNIPNVNISTNTNGTTNGTTTYGGIQIERINEDIEKSKSLSALPSENISVTNPNERNAGVRNVAKPSIMKSRSLQTVESGGLHLAGLSKRRLEKEKMEILAEADESIKLIQEFPDRWIIQIKGADNTLYSNEIFNIQFKFNDRYPIESPEVIFVGVPPVHPHIYSNGHICLSILYDHWSPVLSVSAVCLSIISMLSSCKKKRRPLDDLLYCSTGNRISPKSMKWMFHDDKI